MAITLNLPPEVEASLAARARALGVDLDAYVQTLLQQQVASSPLTAVGDATGEVQRQISELNWLETHGKQYAGR
jgi:hypothetical protein